MFTHLVKAKYEVEALSDLKAMLDLLDTICAWSSLDNPDIKFTKKEKELLQKYKPKNPVTLYRGLNLYPKDPYETGVKAGSKVGDTFTLKMFYSRKVTSWTRSYAIAESFAGDIGIVIEAKIDPQEIFLDFTMLPNSIADTIKHHCTSILKYSDDFHPIDESEVLVLGKKRTVTIKAILKKGSKLKSIPSKEEMFLSETVKAKYELSTKMKVQLEPYSPSIKEEILKNNLKNTDSSITFSHVLKQVSLPLGKYRLPDTMATLRDENNKLWGWSFVSPFDYDPKNLDSDGRLHGFEPVEGGKQTLGMFQIFVDASLQRKGYGKILAEQAISTWKKGKYVIVSEDAERVVKWWMLEKYHLKYGQFLMALYV